MAIDKKKNDKQVENGDISLFNNQNIIGDLNLIAGNDIANKLSNNNDNVVDAEIVDAENNLAKDIENMQFDLGPDIEEVRAQMQKESQSSSAIQTQAENENIDDMEFDLGPSIDEVRKQMQEQNQQNVENEQTVKVDDDFNAIVNEKFKQAIEVEKNEIETGINNIKNRHPNDYDAYVGKLRKTKYYQKCLEKWQRHYDEIRKNCEEEAKKEIEANAREDASKNAKLSNSQLENEKIENNKNETQKVVSKSPESEIDVDEIDFSKHTALTEKGKLPYDTRLFSTVQDVFLDSLYESYQNASDIYNKLSVSKSLAKKNIDLVNFRKDVANHLQQVHNKIIPNQVSVSKKNVRVLQKDIAMAKDTKTAYQAAEIFTDKIYHVDLESNEVSGMIPELAKLFTVKIQDILLANSVPYFNLNKSTITKIIDKIIDTSKLGEQLKENTINKNVSMLDIKVDKRLLKQTNKFKVIFNNLVENYLEDVSDNMVNSDKTTYEYTDEKVSETIEKINQTLSKQGKIERIDSNIIESLALSVGEFLSNNLVYDNRLNGDKEFKQEVENFYKALNDLAGKLTLEEENIEAGILDKNDKSIDKNQQTALKLVENYKYLYSVIKKDKYKLNEKENEDVKADIERTYAENELDKEMCL